MNPIWLICLLARISLIYLILFLYKKNITLSKIILFVIGSGFLYKGLTGSNNEYQISKVFWHEARLMHALFYFAALYYLIKKNIKMVTLILAVNIFFSIGYRILFNK